MGTWQLGSLLLGSWAPSRFDLENRPEYGRGCVVRWEALGITLGMLFIIVVRQA